MRTDPAAATWQVLECHREVLAPIREALGAPVVDPAPGAVAIAVAAARSALPAPMPAGMR